MRSLAFWLSKCANCLYIYEGGSVTRNGEEGLCLFENWNGERNFQIIPGEMALLHITGAHTFRIYICFQLRFCSNLEGKFSTAVIREGHLRIRESNYSRGLQVLTLFGSLTSNIRTLLKRCKSLGVPNWKKIDTNRNPILELRQLGKTGSYLIEGRHLEVQKLFDIS